MDDKPLAVVAYERLRDMMVTLELAPGSLLSQEDLQTRTGLGRTPIHQALQRLEHEEFVVIAPRRGIVVTNVEVTELPVLYESRALLEPYMARQAAISGTTEQWDRMEAVVDAVGGSATTAELVAADRRCHELIWAASGNRFLTRTLDMLYAQSDRLWHMYLIDVTEMDATLEEHRLVLELLRRSDGDGAARAMAQHIRGLHDQINEVIGANLHTSLTAPLGQI
jgi:DNA-binding GntR family transcriptional regulator